MDDRKDSRCFCEGARSVGIFGMTRDSHRLTVAKEHTCGGWVFNNICVKLIAAPVVRTLYVKGVAGLEDLPAGRFIVAANHGSFLDFLSMVACTPRKLTFLAAEKFYSSLFWRPVMEYSGQIKVERASENQASVVKAGLKVLKHGGVLCVFPEGTRSRDGRIGKTHTGVAMFALRAGVPVVPLGIRGAYEVLPPHAGWPRFRKIIELHYGKPMDLTEYGNGSSNSNVLRGVTNRIMTEVGLLAGKEYLPECI